MPSVTTLLAFSGAALLLLVIPGPAVLYILTAGAAGGRTSAIASVAGIHTGTLVHVGAAVAGLSAVLVASAAAFTAVKLAGAVYLVVLGVRMILARGSAHPDGGRWARPRSLRRVYVDGVVLNILNPKTAVFFLAFVPQFVDPDAGNATTQLLVLGATFVLLGMVTDGCYAFASGWVGERLGRSPAMARRKDVVAGTAYIGLGVVTALSGSRTA